MLPALSASSEVMRRRARDDKFELMEKELHDLPIEEALSGRVIPNSLMGNIAWQHSGTATVQRDGLEADEEAEQADHSGQVIPASSSEGIGMEAESDIALAA